MVQPELVTAPHPRTPAPADIRIRYRANVIRIPTTGTATNRIRPVATGQQRETPLLITIQPNLAGHGYLAPYPRTPAPADTRTRIRANVIRIPTTGTATNIVSPIATGQQRETLLLITIQPNLAGHGYLAPYPRTPAPAEIRIRSRPNVIRIPTTGTANNTVAPIATGQQRETPLLITTKPGFICV